MELHKASLVFHLSSLRTGKGCYATEIAFAETRLRVSLQRNVESRSGIFTNLLLLFIILIEIHTEHDGYAMEQDSSQCPACSRVRQFMALALLGQLWLGLELVESVPGLDSKQHATRTLYNNSRNQSLYKTTTFKRTAARQCHTMTFNAMQC